MVSVGITMVVTSAPKGTAVSGKSYVRGLDVSTMMVAIAPASWHRRVFSRKVLCKIRKREREKERERERKRERERGREKKSK